MRPLNKAPWPHENGAPKLYKPHTIAKTDLETDIDNFCSYCEVFSSDLEVEHVISQNQDKTLIHNWDNFLLACGRCNGRDNKTNKTVDLNAIHFPHRNNTFLSFVYEEGGFVKVNPLLKGDSYRNAENMLNLVGLDKIPGNPKYPNLLTTDTRWRHRRTVWEYAKKYLPDYEAGNLTAEQIVEFALQRVFFSVWFQVYNNHDPVKALLINRFLGTAQDCFDSGNGYQPIPRNRGNALDPI